jgi:outer membrane protein assembly factor BamB
MIDPTADGAAPADGWSVAPDGLFRCSMLSSGRIVGQKRCWNCRKGWRKKWKLRVAGDDLPPPLVTEKRVYFGAFDNRVYGVKRKNGHRVWEADLPSRVSEPLARWFNAIGEDGAALDLVILIPDSRTSIIALYAETGARVATYELPQNGGRFIGSPVVTADGKIVAARQKYAAEEASLLVFELVVPPSGSLSAARPGSGPR